MISGKKQHIAYIFNYENKINKFIGVSLNNRVYDVLPGGCSQEGNAELAAEKVFLVNSIK